MPGVLRVQTPEALAPTRGEARVRHRCDQVGCNFQSVEIPTVISRNPVMLTPRPGELANAHRVSLRGQDAAPRPCPSCARDASFTFVGDAYPPPVFFVCHVR